MSTNFNLARLNENGSVDYIYVHWNGSPEDMIPVFLRGEYDASKINTVIEHGFASAIYENLGEQHDFDDHRLSLDNKWCVFYHRDRGDELEILHKEDFSKFVEEMSGDIHIEYCYLLLPDGRFVWTPASRKTPANLSDWREVGVESMTHYIANEAAYSDEKYRVGHLERAKALLEEMESLEKATALLDEMSDK